MDCNNRRSTHCTRNYRMGSGIKHCGWYQSGWEFQRRLKRRRYHSGNQSTWLRWDVRLQEYHRIKKWYGHYRRRLEQLCWEYFSRISRQQYRYFHQDKRGRHHQPWLCRKHWRSRIPGRFDRRYGNKSYHRFTRIYRRLWRCNHRTQCRREFWYPRYIPRELWQGWIKRQGSGI